MMAHTELVQSKSMWLHCIKNGRVQNAVEPQTALDQMELFVRPHEIYGTKECHVEPFIRPCGTARNRLYKAALD